MSEFIHEKRERNMKHAKRDYHGHNALFGWLGERRIGASDLLGGIGHRENELSVARRRWEGDTRGELAIGVFRVLHQKLTKCSMPHAQRERQQYARDMFVRCVLLLKWKKLCSGHVSGKVEGEGMQQVLFFLTWRTRLTHDLVVQLRHNHFLYRYVFRTHWATAHEHYANQSRMPMHVNTGVVIYNTCHCV